MIPLRDNVPSKSFPFVNWGLVLLNFYCFICLARLHPPPVLQSMVNRWAVIPVRLWSHMPGDALTLVSAMFLHGGWLHLISNMIFLHIFGDSVEDSMGHVRYLAFYVIVGVVANATQAYLTASSAIPLIGASGAIAGVLGCYFFSFPHARVTTLIPFFIFFTIREVPAFLFLGLWFLIQTFNGTAMLSSSLVTKQSVGGVAWWAHAGGFLSGLLLAPLFVKRIGKFR